MSGKELKSSDPVQFSLWKDVDDDKTNVIYVWDCAPKYFTSLKDHSKVISRDFTINGTSYTADISPAVFKQNGETVYRVPGEREEFVESAVRRLAELDDDSRWNNETGTVQVRFVMSRLYHLLKEMGHTYDYGEIMEALTILNKASISIRQHQSKEGLTDLTRSTNYLGDLAHADDANHRYVSVTLHPLIGRGIISHQFRNADSKVYFDIRNQLGRFLYRRMCAVWSGAGLDSPYSPKLVSFLEQSPRGLSKEMKQNTRAFRMALQSLQSVGVVENWTEHPEKSGHRIKNMQFQIYPTKAFVNDWKNSHARHRRGENAIKQARIGTIKDLMHPDEGENG